MKKMVSFIMATVLVLTLCCPMTFAAEQPSEAGAVTSMDVVEPRYVVRPITYKLNMQNNTYAVIVFDMAERGNNYYFDGVESISFYNTNPNGSHWRIVDHSYSVSDTEFFLDVTLMDVEGDTISNDTRFIYSYRLTPANVIRGGLSAEEGDSVMLTPRSIRAVCMGGTDNPIVSCRVAGFSS